MDIASVARRIGAGELHYALARFETIRRVYGFVMGLLRRPRRSWTVTLQQSMFLTALVDGAVLDLKRESVARGFDLPPAVVGEVVDYARTTPCHFWEKRFLKDAVKDGRLPDGTEVSMSEVCAPEDCDAIRRLCRDPVLIAVATRQLGYPPTRVKPRLYWSYASSLDDAVRRRQGQSIDWHYDAHALRFCSVNFYLTDVDRENGAHALVCGSHRGKPLSLLLRSATAPDEAIRRHYGDDRVRAIEGPAGTGFFEDTACYHRIIPPQRRDRLMLEIWYS